MFCEDFRGDVTAALNELRNAGFYKQERSMETPQDARIRVGSRRPLLNLCANNYLGLSNHPEIVAAAQKGLEQWGYGLSSVRFICGTQSIHGQLEARLSEFLGAEASILYSSCFDANGGFFEVFFDAEDAIISDALNHASIIDGVRLSKAERLRYRNGDMADLESKLRETESKRRRVIVTDGVFSMDGYLANLPAICDLAERYRALVFVDDSHAVGFLGANGRGTHEHHQVMGRVDVLSGTLGKALGGASGGYVSGKGEIVEMLRQRSRPYLFSNSLAPPIVCASLRALELISENAALRERLHENTRFFRKRLAECGFPILPGEHPIVPVMFGDALVAQRFAQALWERGIYVVSFSFPVVPRDQARIRTQVSAAHSLSELEFAVEQFVEVRAELK